MPFTAGNRGRPVGSRNKNTRAAEAVCKKLVEDRDYRLAFTKRFKAGELAPALEAMVWHYAYGKPTEHHEHTGKDGGPMVYQWQD